jgi:RNA polymerase sigma factor (sigma-70 family)
MARTETAAFWHQAYEDHARVLLAFLGRRLGNSADAEDLLQETFARAMRSGTMDGRAEQRLYLFTVARNLLSNRFRRQRLETRVHGAPASPTLDAPDPLAAVADPRRSPEQDTEWTRFREALTVLLAELPADQRRAFELGILERWSYGEIADHTGWSLARVKTNVFRARQRAIAALGDRLPAGWETYA